MTDSVPSVDVVLSWTRKRPGTTAVLTSDGQSFTEIGRTDATTFTVKGLNTERSYVFAAAGVLPNSALAPESDWEIVRVAPSAHESTPAVPATPSDFAAAQDGANVNFRWGAAGDGVTAAFEIRVGTSWEDGTLVASGLTASPYAWAWWGSGTLTFWLKAIDKLGRASLVGASATVEIAPLQDHVTASTSDEGGGGWSGAKSNMETDGSGNLRLAQIPPHFGAATSPPFGAWTAPCMARYQPSGNYTTPDMNAGALEKARLEVDLAGAAQPIDGAIPFGACLHPALGAKTLPDGTPAPPRLRGFASKNSWRATPLAPVDVKTEIDTSPTPGGAWDGWRPFAPGTYRYWRSRLRVTVTGDGTRFVQVPRLVVTRRKFNKKQEGDVVVNCSPVNVVFPTPFQNPPKVNASLVGYTGTPIVTNVTATGFTIAGGAAVFPGDPATFAPTVHWQAMGT